MLTADDELRLELVTLAIPAQYFDMNVYRTGPWEGEVAQASIGRFVRRCRAEKRFFVVSVYRQVCLFPKGVRVEDQFFFAP